MSILEVTPRTFTKEFRLRRLLQDANMASIAPRLAYPPQTYPPLL